MASIISICNEALSHVGAKSSISALDERSKEARLCNQHYDACRLEVLEAYEAGWNFARSRFTLAVHGEDPPDQWAYRYQYPSGCLKALLIYNPVGSDEPKVPFEIEQAADGSKCILTDMEDAVLIYVKETTDPNLFSRLFCTALSYLLATKICLPLTGDLKILNTVVSAYGGTLEKSEASNANETAKREEPDASWIRARA